MAWDLQSKERTFAAVMARDSMARGGEESMATRSSSRFELRGISRDFVAEVMSSGSKREGL